MINKKFIGRFFFLLSFFVLLFASTTNAQLGTASSSGGSGGNKAFAANKIITGSSVRIRSSPNTSSKEVTQLNFGTLVKSSDRSSDKDTIGDKTDYWYKITTSNGKSGWVFGGFLSGYDAKNSEGSYLEAVKDRLKAENTDFDDNSDLLSFLTRITPQVKDGVAELELYKLKALAKALERIPLDKQSSAHKAFINTNKSKIVYSEPAGQWFVRAELFWNLSKRYRSQPVGDNIAWEAARTYLPGECEGYLPCYIYLMRVTDGEYLKLYPNGEHTSEALDKMSEYLAPIVDDLSSKQIYTVSDDATDRAELRKNLSELRSIVQKTSATGKENVLDQLGKISKAFP